MLTIERLGKIYLDGTQALSNLTLTVGAGEFMVLLGASGCGKTSLLRILAGLEEPSTGRATLDGEAIRGPHPAVGLVFQEPRLLPWSTVADNVAFGLRALPAKQRAARVEAILERVDLATKREKLPRELSGGQQQRVALARALVVEPKVLLLDEPFSALDAMTRESLQDHLLSLWAIDAPTIVMVTHDIEEAAALADRVAVLAPNPGRLSASVTSTIARPRDRESQAFLDMKRRLRAALDQTVAGRRAQAG